jgi:hypothetical protein
MARKAYARAMRKVMLMLICAAVLWVPAASVAGDSSRSSASKPAKTESSRSKGDTNSPAQACKSQLGSAKGHGAGANAFGNCVSTIAMHKAESEGKDSESKDNAESHNKKGANPAMTCKAMQVNDLAHFQTAYGTHPNAFGKCVARQPNSKQG